MSSEFNAIAIIYPAKGRADEVIALLDEVAKYVKANEPGTLKYEITKTIRPDKEGNEDIIMLERYKDQESLKIHGRSEPFLKFAKAAADPQMMRAPFVLKLTTEKGGFASRL